KTECGECTYNQLLNEDSLADTGTAEQTDLATTSIRSEQVDNLDTGDQNLGLGGLLGERRGISVNRVVLGGLDGTALINRVTSDVHDTAQSARADRDLDRSTGIGDR